jgi:hypothetical protein
MKNYLYVVLCIFLVIGTYACGDGDGSGDSAEDGDSGSSSEVCGNGICEADETSISCADDCDSSSSSTRVLTGTIAPFGTSSSISAGKSLKTIGAFDCSTISKAVATATDGSTVTDETIDACEIELSLETGKIYSIVFKDDSDETIAVMKIEYGSLLPIKDGEGSIELGNINFAYSQTTSTEDYLYYIDTDADGTVDSEDDTPCGDSACSDVYSCEKYEYTDEDGDGVCDEFEPTPTAVTFISSNIVFSDPVISTQNNGIIDVSAALYNENIYSAVVEWYGSEDSAIKFYSGTNGESLFDGSIKINSADNRKHRKPALATDASGTVYIAWIDDSEGVGDWNLYVAKSVNDGASFSTPVKVNDANIEASSQAIDIAIDDESNVHVAWCSGADGGWSTYYDRSVDEGETFSTDLQVDSTPTGWGSGTSPDIATGNSGNIYLTWSYGVGGYSNDVYVIHSEDYGATFGSSVRVNETAGDAFNHGSFKYDITLGPDGTIFVLWNVNREEDGNQFSDLYLAKSTDNGETFSDGFKISQTASRIMHTRRMVIDEMGYIYVAWTRLNSAGTAMDGIYFAKSIDGGYTWTEPTLVPSTDDCATQKFDLLVDGTGNIYLIWANSEYNADESKWYNSLYYIKGS